MKMANRRVSRRIPFRTRVSFGVSNPQFSGYTSNISRDGIRIESDKVLPRKSKIVVYIYTDEIDLDGAKMDQVIVLEGVVAWVSPTLPGLRSRMGIKFLSPSDDFKSLYRQKENQYKSDSQIHLDASNS